MFRVLRKFRSRLLIEGETPSYILYGVGEILLVVFGILIALQNNSWKQDRLDRTPSRTSISVFQKLQFHKGGYREGVERWDAMRRRPGRLENDLAPDAVSFLH